MFRIVQKSFPATSYRPDVSVRPAVHFLLALDSLEKPSQGTSSCGLSALLFAGGLLRDDLTLSLVARRCSELCRAAPAEKWTPTRRPSCSFWWQGAFSPLQAGVFCQVPVVARLLNLKNLQQEEEEEEEDWRSVWFLGDTEVYRAAFSAIFFFCRSADQPGCKPPLNWTVLVFLNSLPCFPEAKVWNASFDSLID